MIPQNPREGGTLCFTAEKLGSGKSLPEASIVGGAEPADRGLGGSSLGSAPSQADPRAPQGVTSPTLPGERPGQQGPGPLRPLAAQGSRSTEPAPGNAPGLLAWGGPRDHPLPEVSGAAPHHPGHQPGCLQLRAVPPDWRHGSQPPPPAKFKFVLAITSCLVSSGNQTDTGRGPPQWWPASPRPFLPPSSLLPPSPGRLPGSGPSDGGAPATQRPVPEGETEAAPCQGRGPGSGRVWPWARGGLTPSPSRLLIC